tara:strand:+ start:154 stop:405 length:252 start_codon:yes stop_codon:yes gene_type:complete
MHPLLLKFFTRFGVPAAKQKPIAKAVFSKPPTLGGVSAREDHLDFLLKDAGIPTMVKDEMTGNFVVSNAASELNDIIKIIRGS